MHICIIGTGASGLLASCELVKLDFVKKITIIGSSRIPSIKVGESTTSSFFDYVRKNFDINEFVTSTDAAVKYGVYFKNWSKRDYIHHFSTCLQTDRHNIHYQNYYELLSNKDPETDYHSLVAPKLWKFIQKNQVSLNYDEHNHSWHFDAGKLKIFLKRKLSENNKITFIDDEIIDSKFSREHEIDYLIGKKNNYIADYYVNCSGNSSINETVFKEEYEDLSKYLLTNKAVVCPLPFKDKRKEFHPYTVAKTMNNGWRWITPTQSRIGTGYVFSDNHISDDEAIHELLTDIGDHSLNPFVVDFTPKCSRHPFKINYCSIGMSSGFVEPLDAPGLSTSITQITGLTDLLKNIREKQSYFKLLNDLNFDMMMSYQWWCSYILHQYKTCWKTDTKFWLDHKNVVCPFYESIIQSFKNIPKDLFENAEYDMFFKTTAAKDIQWESSTKKKPFVLNELDTETVHHIDFIESFYS